MLAVGRIDVGNAWRSVAGSRPLVARGSVQNLSHI
jgi:hypothetical protein